MIEINLKETQIVNSQMEALVELHDNIMFYLVVALISIFWIMVSIIINFNSKNSPISSKFLNHGTLIELTDKYMLYIIGFITLVIVRHDFILMIKLHSLPNVLEFICIFMSIIVFISLFRVFINMIYLKDRPIMDTFILISSLASTSLHYPIITGSIISVFAYLVILPNIIPGFFSNLIIYADSYERYQSVPVLVSPEGSSQEGGEHMIATLNGNNTLDLKDSSGNKMTLKSSNRDLNFRRCILGMLLEKKIEAMVTMGQSGYFQSQYVKFKETYPYESWSNFSRTKKIEYIEVSNDYVGAANSFISGIKKQYLNSNQMSSYNELENHRNAMTGFYETASRHFRNGT